MCRWSRCGLFLSIDNANHMKAFARGYKYHVCLVSAYLLNSTEHPTS